MLSKKQISEEFQKIQSEICGSLEALENSARFSVENWERPQGGGGLTRVIQNGDIFEKGGVNFSEVQGLLPAKIVKALGVADDRFFATGVSIVIHPKHPSHPIIHMNIRYFELQDGTFWFGGGIDLTPIYIEQDEAKFFHQQLKNTCDQYDPEAYPKFKDWADDYFFNQHRNETRGIGGIFFDRLAHDKQKTFDFVCQVGRTFAPTYLSILQNKTLNAVTPDQKQWQSIRRSRYVEFNLVYDKGTKFGLETNGRIESILMSMPPHASWVYDHQPLKGTPETSTLELLKKGINWI